MQGYCKNLFNSKGETRNIMQCSDSQVLLDGWLHLAGTVQTLQVNPPGSQTAWQPGSTLLLLLDVFLECLNPPSSCVALFDMYAGFRGNACTYQADPGNGSVTNYSNLIKLTSTR